MWWMHEIDCTFRWLLLLLVLLLCNGAKQQSHVPHFLKSIVQRKHSRAHTQWLIAFFLCFPFVVEFYSKSIYVASFRNILPVCMCVWVCMYCIGKAQNEKGKHNIGTASVDMCVVKYCHINVFTPNRNIEILKVALKKPTLFFFFFFFAWKEMSKNRPYKRCLW